MLAVAAVQLSISVVSEPYTQRKHAELKNRHQNLPCHTTKVFEHARQEPSAARIQSMTKAFCSQECGNVLSRGLKISMQKENLAHADAADGIERDGILYYVELK